MTSDICEYYKQLYIDMLLIRNCYGTVHRSSETVVLLLSIGHSSLFVILFG